VAETLRRIDAEYALVYAASDGRVRLFKRRSAGFTSTPALP
jgi:Txe/YoeB family toxin of Txe-Axe toxin-antitoxin module